MESLCYFLRVERPLCYLHHPCTCHIQAGLLPPVKKGMLHLKPFKTLRSKTPFIFRWCMNFSSVAPPPSQWSVKTHAIYIYLNFFSQVEEIEEPGCDKCDGDEDTNCKFCGCRICGGKEEVDTLLVCEGCEFFFHMKCLDPPLEEIPEDDWFCANEQCQKKKSETALLCSVSMVTHVVGNLQVDDFYNLMPLDPPEKEKGKPGRPRKDENLIDEDGNFIKKGPIILDEGWGDEAIECKWCNDDESSDCKFCGCRICGGKDEPETMLVCEFCEYFFHMKCLDPPLEAIPEEDWFCSNETCQKKQDQTAIMQSVSMVTHVIGNLTFDNLVVDNHPVVPETENLAVDTLLETEKPAVDTLPETDITENGFVNEQENKSNEQTKEE